MQKFIFFKFSNGNAHLNSFMTETNQQKQGNLKQMLAFWSKFMT